MKRIGYFRFPIGESEEMTKKNIQEKLKINKVEVENVINVDYQNRIVWYKEEIK